MKSEKLNISGDASISGNLSVTGNFNIIHTDTSTTEQITVTNDGTGPALIVNQKGSQPVVNFKDDNTSVFYIEDGGNIGLNKTNPDSNLHINTSASSNSPIHVEQNNNSSPVLKITGTSVLNDTSKTLVISNSSVSAATVKGFVRVQLIDTNNTNGLSDGSYYIPLYTLT